MSPTQIPIRSSRPQPARSLDLIPVGYAGYTSGLALGERTTWSREDRIVIYVGNI